MSSANDLIYSEAKKALNVSTSDSFSCRVKENDELKQIILDCFDNDKTLSLYVNGQPGTGKTLSVTNILENLKVLIFIFKTDIYFIFKYKLFFILSQNINSNKYS